MAEEEKQDIEVVVNEGLSKGNLIAVPKGNPGQRDPRVLSQLPGIKSSPMMDEPGLGTFDPSFAEFMKQQARPGIESVSDSVTGTSGQLPLSTAFMNAYGKTKAEKEVDELRKLAMLWAQGEHDAGKPPPPEGVWANLKDLAQKRSFQRFAGMLGTAALGGPDRGRDVAEFDYHFGKVLESDRLDQQRTDALKRQQITDDINRRKVAAEELQAQTQVEQDAFDRAVVLANTLTRLQWRRNPYAAELLAKAGLPPDVDLSERIWKADPNTKMIRKATRKEIINGEAESLGLAETNLESINKQKKPWSEEVAEKLDFYAEQGIELDEIDRQRVMGLSYQERGKWQTIKDVNGTYYSWNPVTKKLYNIGLKAWQGDKQPDKYPKIIANATSGYLDVKELIGIIQDIGLRQAIVEGSLGFGARGQNIENLKNMIADKIGRLRSGGAINKEEEERFLGYLSMGLPAFLWGTGEGTINNLERLLNEFKIVGMRIDSEFGGKITGEQWDEELSRENEQEFGRSVSRSEYMKGNRKIISNPGLDSGATKQNIIIEGRTLLQNPETELADIK